MIHIVAGMNGNFHDPGLDTALAMKTIQSPVYLHKRFLHSILRQCLVAQVEETHPQYRSLILRYQFFKIRVLSFVRALDIAHVLSPPSLIQTDERKIIFHFLEKSGYGYHSRKKPNHSTQLHWKTQGLYLSMSIIRFHATPALLRVHCRLHPI